MTKPVPYLVVRSREVLHMNQAELATFLGVGARTVQRWEAKRASPYAWNLQKLADAVRLHDAELAAEIDVWAPPSAPPPAPVVGSPRAPDPPLPAPPPIPAVVLVDSVVCAAAEAMTVAPQAIRPAVLAAFARAREAGLTQDAVLAVLAPPPPPPVAAPTGKGTKRAS